jgi:uncharacterized protein
MTTEEWGVCLGDLLADADVTVPEGAILSSAADDILEMASAYHADGWSFYMSGDRVNALAAFAYGIGWLDAGCALGLLVCQKGHPTLDQFRDAMPEGLLEHLHEKTTRYHTLLELALAQVEEGPDPESPLFRGAVRFLSAARSGLENGNVSMRGRDCTNALAWLSYGYAWLDAGVRAGLLSIRDRRDLFTV